MSSPDLMGALGILHAEQPLPRRKPHNTNRGKRFPPDPIRVDDFAKLLAACTPLVAGRLGELAALQRRAIVVVLYRTGVRISELLAFEDRDLIREDRALVVRNGKGGKRRTMLMDEWGWRELDVWLRARTELPPGPVFCVIRCANPGGPLSATDVRRQLRALGKRAGVTRRVAPHQFRHGFAVEARHEKIDLYALQQQLGHAHLGITEVYFRSIDPLERLAPIGHRPPPMIVVPSARR